MGILQTAMITGGGLYAVGKLAKGMEQRGSSRGNNQQYQPGPYPPQGPQGQQYWGPPPPGPPPTRNNQEAYYQDNNQQRYDYPPPPNDPRDGSRGYQYSQERYYGNDKPQQGYYGNGGNPPAYGGAGDCSQQPQGQYQGQYQGQDYEQGNQRGQSGGFDSSSLMSMAGLAMNAVGGDDKGGKKSKGMGMIGEFLNKK